MAVGTAVAFKDGEPNRQKYVNFRIKDINGVDDYGMMAEMVKRRVKRKPLPDLFLVDGGKGHLAAVIKAMDQSDVKGSAMPEVISIAKPDEHLGEVCDKIYIHGRKNPVRLKGDHPVLLLMMRIRDEAHRRAISYHRNLRSKSITRSRLDGIHGVGAKRKQLLLRHFKGINQLSNAKVEDLCRVPGISGELAERVVEALSSRSPKKEGCQPKIDEKAEDIV